MSSLPWSATVKSVITHFGQGLRGVAGEKVVWVHFQSDDNVHNKAMLEFASAASAQRALSMHGSVLHSKIITVAQLPSPESHSYRWAGGVY